MKIPGLSLCAIFACCVVIAACSQVGLSRFGYTPNADIVSERQVSPTNYHVLYYFKGSPDGANPSSGNLIELHGVLYGNTGDGGRRGDCPMHGGLASGCGAVFAVNPASGTEHVVYTFRGRSDGQHPVGGLVAMDGLLYGTTYAGGLAYGCDSGVYGKGCGTVFEVNPSTGKHRVIYAFDGHSPSDGAAPGAGLIAVDGVLYGTTGGGDGHGTVFKVTRSASGYKESVLYGFKGRPDGAGPGSGPLLALNGNLYGTTAFGGRGTCGYPSSPSIGCGTVFEVNMHTGAERIIYRFKGGRTDGLFPAAGLIDVKGEVYSTTAFGGKGPCDYQPGEPGPRCGTVFKLNVATGKESILYNFQGFPKDGAWIFSGLVALNRSLYGTTGNGGSTGRGIIYKLVPYGDGYRESVLHNFLGGVGYHDGDHSYAGLLYLHDKLYGTTQVGGSGNCGGRPSCGIVFEIAP